jgi:hypothetical protein
MAEKLATSSGILDGGFMSGLKTLAPNFSSGVGGDDTVTSAVTAKGDFIVGGKKSSLLPFIGGGLAVFALLKVLKK